MKFFTYDLDTLIAVLQRRSSFMVRELVDSGVARAEANAAKGKRSHHGYRITGTGYYRQNRRAVRRKYPATGVEKVEMIESRTYHQWTNVGFLSPFW